MPLIQDIIYKLELGAGQRVLRWIFVGGLLLGLFLGYNFRGYKNMASEEAMDSAQLARNIAEGKGYTTLFIRPISTYLLQKNGVGTYLQQKSAEHLSDPARLNSAHPDLANPPLYPCLLAGLMKILPFHYPVNSASKLWGNSGMFWWYEPDFLIALFNELLFLAAVALTFFLARRLFDNAIAWMSALLLAGTELFWRFSVSGLSTNLLLVLFLLLAWCLVWLEALVREGRGGQAALLVLAAAAGVITGLGGLTRYGFGWMILPVAGYVLLVGGQRRVALTLLCIAAFAAMMLPWVARNVAVSGLPFGTATYAAVEGTGKFTEQKLERSLNPNFEEVGPAQLLRKLLANTRQIVVNDLPRIGGSWVTAYFLAGLLVTFRSPAISRLRYFMLASLAMLIVVQALGRTHLSDDSPEINSENLIILLFPLVLMYGVCLFFLLLEQVPLPDLRLRKPLIAMFGLVSCAPMILALLPPRTIPVAYPPYLPPIIQSTTAMMKDDELMMSDVPWAVAWYGRHQCMSLTLNARADFFAVNDELKAVKGIYLTPVTLDARFFSEWIRPGPDGWGPLIINPLIRQPIPTWFPLRAVAPGYQPEQLFLTDWERWKQTGR